MPEKGPEHRHFPEHPVKTGPKVVRVKPSTTQPGYTRTKPRKAGK